MRSLALRMLLLAAMLLTPLGMAGARAGVPHDPARSAMAMRDCSDKKMHHGQKAGFAECTMVCSAALPAADIQREDAPMILCEPAPRLLVQRLLGLHPEIATPPPKHS
jgi:hypothetical protein